MSRPLTVATFNMCSGRSPNGLIEPERLPQAIKALEADVLAIQEVDRDQRRSSGADQIAVVAEAFGAVTSRLQPTLSGQPGPATGWRPLAGAAFVTESGEAGKTAPAGAGPVYGVGLVSRLPVLAWRALHLGGSRAVLPFPVPRPGRRLPGLLMVPDEPRVALAAVVETGTGPVTVICTHLSFAPPVAVKQLRRIVRWAATLPGPRILAGDLNLPGGLPARITGWRRLTAQQTYPAPAPRVQLDHLLTDTAGRHDEHPSQRLSVSDHRPARVTLHSGLG
jgi:endonuclease/exonuclease/phosphatase family metal-dependent hydrolase